MCIRDRLESGLAPAYCPGYGYEPSMREAIFTVGVQSVSEDYEEMKKIEQVILDTLKEVVEKGFDKQLIEVVMHQVELTSRMPQSNFGYAACMNILPYLVNKEKGLGLSMLQIEENLTKIREKVQSERCLLYTSPSPRDS
eukprot:TRINITY_DN21765_c0_g1_i1.p1 TRINITY_DN21765_c0_g1~~TRINITY_DN21765_c0_g1_i1.p1  ORF type:complete len:140 (-),score=30.86 TRINITY_DN21765_c0_g1_i1:36-455(-)